MSEKKTADLKKYQADYAKAHPRDNKEYMKNYMKNAEDVECPVCKAAGTPGHFKTYAKYRHDATKKHKTAELLLEAKNELAKREKEEAEAQAAALAKEAKKQTIRIKKKKSKKEEKKEEPKKEEKKEEPKKAEKEEKTKIKINRKRGESQKKKEENIKLEVKEKPKEKAAALKALEEYSSSSSSEEEEEKLEDTVFYFQGKEIDAEKVAEYIEEHHESSVNPERAPDTKTKRQNKNASLWRKVRKELDGKKWSYLGQHFGEIVTKAYDKPNSQADLVSLLKMVAMHFTTVPMGEQKAINALARKLKESQTAKSK